MCRLRACPAGYHVARFGTAVGAGVITGDDLVAVLQTFDVFTTDSIVWDTK